MRKLFDTWKKLTNGSINRQIFGAAVTVAMLTALAKVATVARELVVAWRFGTGNELDAFLIALLVPSFIISVVAGSFNAALIPTYIHVREEEGAKAAQKLFSGATVWSLVLLGITTILTVVTAPVYLPLLASGFSPQKLDLTFHLLCAIAPFILLSGIIVIWGAVLNAGERFALVALSPIITPIITIVFLLVFNFSGVYALAMGLVCGTALEMVTLGASLHRQGISLWLKFYKIDANLRQVANQYAPALAGAFFMCSAGLVDQSMAAMLSPGSVSTLNYATKLIALPLTLTTTALSTAVIPYFSKMIACKDWTGLERTFKHYMRLIFFATVPLTGLLLLFSELIVKIIFQRGYFTASDTHLVAETLDCFALQIPFYVADILVVKLLTSMCLNYILMSVSIFNLIINIALNYIFLHWIGIKGIALSTSCVYLFSFFYLLFFAKKKLALFLKSGSTV